MSIMQLTQTIQILPPLTSNRVIIPRQPALPGLEPEQTIPPIVTNRQIAEALSSIADCWNLKTQSRTDPGVPQCSSWYT